MRTLIKNRRAASTLTICSNSILTPLLKFSNFAPDFLHTLKSLKTILFMYKKLLLTLAFCLPMMAFAQTGGVKGKIVEQGSAEPMIGVTIIVDGTTKGTVTDLDGNFVLKGLATGKKKLKITYIGYADMEKEVEVKADQIFDLGILELESTSIGLEEIEVFADVVEDRKTPVAVSKVDAIIISEQLGGMQLPEILNSTPGVYATKGDGSFGDARINIRGFGQEETLFMINGVPLNDMENGRMFWSNFAGLSEITRNMEVQRGLGASKLGVNSVGGTINIITKPAEKKKGGAAELQLGNGSWTNRYRVTLNTGEMKGGWAATFQGARTTGDGYMDGAYVDSWSYYLSVSKEINNDHTLLFTLFGAPTDRGTVFTTSLEDYERFDSYTFNPATGYLNGEFFNTRQNKAHKPQATLMHLWNINEKMFLTTSAYTSIARVYSTITLRGANSPSFSNTTDGLLPLDDYRNANINNTQTITSPYGDPNAAPITGAQSQYILESRHNDHNWFGVISSLNWQINSTTSAVLGVDFRDYTGLHYVEVRDLYGGEFFVDQTTDGGDLVDRDILNPNNVVRVGDKMRYNYDGNVGWGSAFAQLEKTFAEKFDAFLSANISRTQMWRYGHFWNGESEFINNSFGASDKRVFNNYNVKAGINYRLNGRHNLFVNGGLFTRAPFLANSFQDNRNSNTYLEGLKSETINSVELGYRYRGSKFKANVNLYYTQWEDRAFTRSFIDPETSAQIFFAITGQAAVHQGFELELIANPVNNLEIRGMLSVGDWFWSNNVNATIVDNTDPDTELGTINVFSKDLPVGNSAQTTASLNAHYKLNDGYFGVRFNHFDRLYEDYTPETIASESARDLIDRLPDYQIVDIYGGYYFKLGENRARVNANIHNLLNQVYVRRQNRFGSQVGYLINYNLGFALYF